MVSTTKAALSIAIVACIQSQCTSFVPESATRRQKLVYNPKQFATSVQLAAATPASKDDIDLGKSSLEPHCQHRRSVIASSLAFTFGIVTCFNENVALAADGKLDELLGQIKEARGQLESVPDLIKAEKWDAVRAVLVKPPLSNMWTTGGQNKLLNNYADAIGNELPDGDEIAALELREDLISHLRYLDMAVYNNVFNPIATEGQSGATKELVRSYYEDPTNEYTATKSAIDNLIGLASP
mmetsp:Transcript_36647/g.76898  ORF Transcript_36647/g.76898 Transcript_36647/m.76898 type:complete len:240 (-) Transcript_36647:258-977(-)